MNIELFKESPMLDGYAIAVRNDWSFHIEREFVTKKEKDQYLQDFDHQIVTKERFFQWWCKLHNCYGPQGAQDKGEGKQSDTSDHNAEQ